MTALAVPFLLGGGALYLWHKAPDRDPSIAAKSVHHHDPTYYDVPTYWRNRLDYFGDDRWKPDTGLTQYAMIDDMPVGHPLVVERQPVLYCHPGLTRQNGKLVNNRVEIDMIRQIAQDPLHRHGQPPPRKKLPKKDPTPRPI